jgi:hypothetical protein
MPAEKIEVPPTALAIVFSIILLLYIGSGLARAGCTLVPPSWCPRPPRHEFRTAPEGLPEVVPQPGSRNRICVGQKSEPRHDVESSRCTDSESGLHFPAARNAKRSMCRIALVLLGVILQRCHAHLECAAGSLSFHTSCVPHRHSLCTLIPHFECARGPAAHSKCALRFFGGRRGVPSSAPHVAGMPGEFSGSIPGVFPHGPGGAKIIRSGAYQGLPKS